MKHKNFLFIAIMFAIAFCTSCTKKTTTNNNNNNNTTTAGFTWSENGGATVTADSAFWVTGTWGTGIRAFKGSTAGGDYRFFEINWATQNNTSTGSKALISFDYIKSSESYTGNASQSVSVTGFTNNKLSGNGTIAVTGSGSTTSIAITYTDLVQK